MARDDYRRVLVKHALIEGAASFSLQTCLQRSFGRVGERAVIGEASGGHGVLREGASVHSWTS